MGELRHLKGNVDRLWGHRISPLGCFARTHETIRTTLDFERLPTNGTTTRSLQEQRGARNYQLMQTSLLMRNLSYTRLVRSGDHHFRAMVSEPIYSKLSSSLP